MSVRIMVFGLPERLREADVHDLFEVYGQLLDVEIPLDPLSARPLGHALLRYAAGEGAARARDALDGKTLLGEILEIREIPEAGAHAVA